MFEIPAHIRPLRERVLRFVEERLIPEEKLFNRGGPEARARIEELKKEAKAQDLWALGHPKDIGGGGLPFLDFVYINEVVGRCWAPAQLALGTKSMQTCVLLHKYCTPEQRKTLLLPEFETGHSVGFAVTEPEVSSSDPTQLRTQARLEGDHWVIDGRKWFISGAAWNKHLITMCRTEGEDVPPHQRFSMIAIPTDAPGVKLGRDPVVLGLHDLVSGHNEVFFENVRIPAASILGERGQGFRMAQERLGPGRIYHCMRWLGMAERAFDLMCARANVRMLRGEPLAKKQLIQKMAFESYTEIQSARLAVLHAAALVDKGDEARLEISAVKVQCPRMAHNVIDRAMQVHGAMGMSDETPLEHMYRTVRYGRIVDGPDEAHIERVGKILLRAYRDNGPGWQFALR